MKILGARLRQRRRQLRLHQKAVTKGSDPSLLSKVETGATSPSLRTLREWAITLETTMSSLLGDELLLEAAKQTILEERQCHAYLKQLPPSKTTTFLKQLSRSACSLSIPVPQPPEDPELQYLTAKVLLKRGTPQEAAFFSEQALLTNNTPLWRIYHLTLLCQIYEQLSEPAKRKQAKKELQAILSESQTLPPPATITHADLELLKLKALFETLKTCIL